MSISSLFKKLIAVILMVFSFLVPFDEEGIEMEIKVNNDEKQMIVVEWTNNTGKMIDEPRFFVEKKIGDKWEQIDFAPGFGFKEIYTQYYPSEGSVFNINTLVTFGEELAEGEYRFTFCYRAKFFDGFEAKQQSEEFSINQ